MGETENLNGVVAIEKIKAVAENQMCHFVTFADVTGGLSTRPMATQGIDDDGTLYFFSKRNSTKNRDILVDDRVQLLYANSSDSSYLSVYGVATIREDRAKIATLWSVFAKTWFPDGPDDPELTLLAVRPLGAHYWDTKHGKMVQLAGIALGALTGKMTDDGREGMLVP